MPGICPTKTCKISPHGGFAFWRAERQVYHFAWDLSGAKGTPVYAPEDGVVVEIGTGAVSPWIGYNPGIVLMLGASGKYHLMAHLDYPNILVRPGQQVTMGQQVGSIGTDHTHWEVRTKRVPDYSDYDKVWQAHGANNTDPAKWLAAVNSMPAMLFRGGQTAGIVVAVVGLGLSFLIARALFSRAA